MPLQVSKGFVSTALPSIGTSGTTVRHTEVHELDSGGITLDLKRYSRPLKFEWSFKMITYTMSLDTLTATGAHVGHIFHS
jgi:hypothetical protein